MRNGDSQDINQARMMKVKNAFGGEVSFKRYTIVSSHSFCKDLDRGTVSHISVINDEMK